MNLGLGLGLTAIRRAGASSPIDTLIAAVDTIAPTLDAYWVIAASTVEDAAINSKNPGTHDLTIGGGAPTFTANAHWATDGSDDWLDTNLNPSTAGGNFERNSACWGFWNVLDANTANGSGAWDGDGVFILPRSSSAVTTYRINQSSAGSAPVASAVGFWMADRSGATATTRLFRHGTRHIQANAASTALNDLNLRLGARAADAFHAGQFAFAAAGGSLTVQQHWDLFVAVNTYMTSLGQGVTPVKNLIDGTIGQSDPVSAVDITGNGLPDLLVPQNDGVHYWYEHTTPGQFTRHTIRGTTIASAIFEGAHWGDMDEDGEYEAYTADQPGEEIWCHVQDSPGTPTGTWTGGIIATGKEYVQNLLVVDLDGTPALLYVWEGGVDTEGGIGCLTYDGSGDITSAANWTDTVLVQHNGAWHIDPAGLIEFGGETILAFAARNQRNTTPDTGVFYITKPEGSALQSWAETDVFADATDADWLHVASGDFFGNAVSTDLAVHDVNGNIKLFDSSNAWAAVDLSTSQALGQFNLINLGRQENGRDVLLSTGATSGGLWEWSGSAWAIAQWDVRLSKSDGPMVRITAGDLNMLVFVDSLWFEVVWVNEDLI